MKKKLTFAQQERVKELARLTPAEWDAICKRCGICCLRKVAICFEKDVAKYIGYNGTLYLKLCCDHFNTKTKCCNIYQTRLQASNCCKVDMDVILAGELLPASCGYVEYIFGPAPFPANVDFNMVRPIDNAKMARITSADAEKEIILKSFLWNLRRR